MTETQCDTEGCEKSTAGRTGFYDHLCSECDIKRIARIEAYLMALKMAPKSVVVICRTAVDGRFDDNLAEVASSWEKAEAWIKKNSPHWCNETLWWWYGYETVIDNEWGWRGRHRFFDRNGVEHNGQASLVPDNLRHLTPWDNSGPPKHLTLWARPQDLKQR